MTARRSRGVSQSDYETLAEFRAALREFLAFSETAAKAAGLTPRQHQALLAIKGGREGRAPAIGELARRLRVRHHSAVSLVDRLVALGLVRRRTATSDRRRVELGLTRLGERKLERLSAAHREELRQVAPRLEALLASIKAGPIGRG